MVAVAESSVCAPWAALALVRYSIVLERGLSGVSAVGLTRLAAVGLPCRLTHQSCEPGKYKPRGVGGDRWWALLISVHINSLSPMILPFIYCRN